MEDTVIDASALTDVLKLNPKFGFTCDKRHLLDVKNDTVFDCNLRPNANSNDVLSRVLNRHLKPGGRVYFLQNPMAGEFGRKRLIFVKECS